MSSYLICLMCYKFYCISFTCTNILVSVFSSQIESLWMYTFSHMFLYHPPKSLQIQDIQITPYSALYLTHSLSPLMLCQPKGGDGMRFVGEKRAIRIFFLTVFLLSHCISYIDASCLESSFCYVAQIYSSITTGFNYTICLLYAFNHSNGKSLSLWLVFLCLIIPCCCCFFLWNSNRSLYIVPSINAFF